MAIDYKQYNYPTYTYCQEPFPNTACGPCSVADLLEVSPITIANWMTSHGYAAPYQGTEWEGINKCLTAYGANGVLLATGLLGKMDSPQFKKWEETIQSGREGILLMGRGINNYWTNGGHYIAIVKYEAGKYLVYDPASASRTGWHPFSDFAGDIKNLYTSSLLWGSPKTYNYAFKVATINMGSNNKSVLLAQKILYAQGYYDKKLGFDGYFGPGTLAAVKSFQNKNKLEIDGSCGPKTWTKLLGIEGDTKVVSQIKRGSQGVDVILLQELLTAEGMYLGRLDGDFGPATETALRQYQMKKGLTVDGICGPDTWRVILEL